MLDFCCERYDPDVNMCSCWPPAPWLKIFAFITRLEINLDERILIRELMKPYPPVPVFILLLLFLLLILLLLLLLLLLVILLLLRRFSLAVPPHVEEERGWLSTFAKTQTLAPPSMQASVTCRFCI